MKPTFGILALAATAKLVSAHATVFAVWINDEDQGLGNTADGYIRSPPNNSPVTDVTSSDMACNVNGNKAAAKTLSVQAGDKITFEWHHNTRDASDDIIDLSHLGPVLVYMAPTDKGAAGNGWVKIAEDGYSDGTWAVKTLVDNRGKHSITVPDVPAGDYLFRPEIIALHEGNRQGGAQFYMECVQVSVTSDGSNALPEGVSIPGAYSATDPGVLFDLYNGFDSYPIPGPAVWNGASGSGSGSGSSKPSTSSAAATSTSSAPPATSTATKVVPTTTASSAPSTLSTIVRPTSTEAPASTEPADSCPSNSPSTGNGAAAKVWEQCGGINHSGATTCESGLTCKQWNPYYHQCVEA